MLRKLGHPLFLVLVPFLMYVQLWHGKPEERQWLVGDPGDAYWPDLRAFELALADGQFPLWNPYDRAGFPFAADPQPGLMYPLNWLLVAMGRMSGGVSFNLLQFKLLLHLSIAGVGMYMFLRNRGLPRAAGTMAGVAYQFGGFLTYNLWFSLNWPLAWTPLFLRAIDRVTERPSYTRAIELAIMAGITVTAGSPPSMFYSCLVAIPYFVFRLVGSKGDQSLRSWVLRYGPALLVAGVLACIFSVPQLISTMKLSKDTLRAAPGYSFAASGSIGADELLGFVLRAGSGHHFYMGIVAVFLAVFALHHRDRKDVAFFGAMSVLGALLMLGSNTHVFRLFYELVPGVSLFRIAFRYSCIASIGLSILAGYGTACLIERHTPESALRYAGTFVVVVVFIALWLRLINEPVRDPALSRDLFVAAMLLSFAWCVAYGLRHGEKSTAFAVCLIGLACVDFAIHVPRANMMRPGVRERSKYLSDKQLAELRRDVAGYRIYNEFALGDRPGSRMKIRDFRGYMDPLLLSRYALLMTDEIRIHPSQVLRLFNVKYLLFAPHAENNMSHHFVPNPAAHPNVKKKSEHIFELIDPAPNAYWVEHVDILPNDHEVLLKLHHVDYHKGALVARQDLQGEQLRWLRKLKGSRPAVAARVVSRTFNDVVFQAKAPADGLLVINEAYFDGWHAEVDGQEVPIVRVNSLMQGVRLKPGAHRVVLRFRPYYYVVPALLAGLTLLGLVLLGMFHVLRSGLLARAIDDVRTRLPRAT